MRYAKVLVWVVVLSLTTLARAADVQVHAFLDRDHITLGDSVTLNVKVDGSNQVDAPDLSALEQDFRLQGTSRSSELSLANGQRTESTLWAVSLSPRHTGTLTIPALKVAGQSTQQLTLVVTQPSPNAQGTPGGPVFVEASPSTLTPYLGQQIDFTVRLFYLADLTDGSLDIPRADGVDVRRVGRDIHYQTQRGGRTYHVVERHYALIPQRAGTIEVPGIAFQGQALSSTGFGSFMSMGRPVSARSPAVTLKVQPIPASMKGGPWVPARSLTLTMEGMPANGQVQVGEPLTLTLHEQATGLPFESLPELTLPQLSGAQVYPDKTQNKTSQNGAWLVGERERKFALVPTHAGTLQLPEITLRWWDVVHQRAETARISASTLTVVPAAAGLQGSSATPANSAQAATGTSTVSGTTDPAKSVTAPVSVASASVSDAAPWRTVALLSLGLWLLSAGAVGVIWLRRRSGVAVASGTATEAPVARGKRHLFIAAVRRGDARAAAESLLRWAQSERPQLLNLGELAQALASPAQREAIGLLQRSRFAAGAADQWDGNAIAAAFRTGLAWKDVARASDDVLPPLYPRGKTSRRSVGGAETTAR